MNAKTKRDFLTIYVYGILVLMLFCSGTPLQSLYNKQLSLALFFSLIPLLYFNKRNILQMVKNGKYGITVLIGLLFISMLVNTDPDFTHYIGIAVTIVSSYVFIQLIREEEFSKKYINIMTVIAAYSVIVTVIANLNISAVGKLPLLVSGDSEWHYIGVFQYFWGWHQWTTMVRNAACFREPGVWGCYCCMALLLHLQNIKQHPAEGKKERAIVMCKFCVLFIGILTSVSTTAILCLCLCVVIYFLEIRKLNLFSYGIIGAGVVFVGLFWDRLFSKFSKSNESFISFQERLDGVFAGLESFFQNPVTGSGYTKYLAGIKGTSANSFADVLGKYGIVVFAILAAGLVRFIRNMKLSPASKMIVAVCVFIMLGTQNLWMYPVFLCITFYGLFGKKEKQESTCRYSACKENGEEKGELAYEPLISVIVPVYNVEKYVRRCLESIINQTYENLEIIVVDDGSQDSSGAICDEMAELDGRISVIHKKNEGLSEARNTGIERAKGAYIGFVDSDDCIDPDMYRRLVTACIQHNAQISMCGRICETEGTNESYELFTCEEKILTAEEAVNNFLLQRDCDAASWDKLYKARLFKKIRFPLGMIHEDLIVCAKLLASSNRVVHVGVPLYHHTIRKDSICGQPFSKRRFDVYNQACKVREFIKKYVPSQKKEADCFVLGNVKALLYSAAASSTCGEEDRKRIKDILDKEITVSKKNQYVPASEIFELRKAYLKLLIKSAIKKCRR